MSKTRADLIARVLSRLGKAEAGQPVSAEDTAAVDPYLDGIAGELSSNSIVYLATLDDIDDAFFDPLSAIVADRLADDFGLSVEEAAKAKGRADDAERRLRRMGRGTILDRPVRVDYY